MFELALNSVSARISNTVSLSRLGCQSEPQLDLSDIILQYSPNGGRGMFLTEEAK